MVYIQEQRRRRQRRHAATTTATTTRRVIKILMIQKMTSVYIAPGYELCLCGDGPIVF